jgi:hypothetical protein
LRVGTVHSTRFVIGSRGGLEFVWILAETCGVMKAIPILVAV